MKTIKVTNNKFKIKFQTFFKNEKQVFLLAELKLVVYFNPNPTT